MPRRKRTPTEKALAAAIKVYNQRIDRAVSSGRLRPEQAPERKSMKKIAEQTRGLSPQMAGRARAKLTRELRKISDKNALDIVKTEGGLEITMYELGHIDRLTTEAKKVQQRSQAEKRRRAREEMKRNGLPISEAMSWTDEIGIPHPAMANDFETFRQKVESLELIGGSGEWSKYRANLLKNFEMHYSGKDLRRLKTMLSKMSDKQLKEAYEAGEDFASQGYHYEANRSAIAAIESMRNYMRK